MTTLNLEALSAAELSALMGQLREKQKDARAAENARYAELGRDLVSTILTEHGVEASEYSERVGVSTQSLTIEVEGKTYTFYVSIKDVAASEKRAAAVKAGEVTLKKRKPKKDKGDASTEDTDTEDEEKADA